MLMGSRAVASTAATGTAVVAAPSALVGDQTLAPSADSNNAGVAQAFSYTATGSGTTSDIELYVNTGTTATKLYLGLYADNGGEPGALLASGALSSPVSSAWNDVSVGSTAVTAGSTYWIALLGTGGALYYPDTWGGSGASYVESNSALSSTPNGFCDGL